MIVEKFLISFHFYLDLYNQKFSCYLNYMSNFFLKHKFLIKHHQRQSSIAKKQQQKQKYEFESNFKYKKKSFNVIFSFDYNNNKISNYDLI
jgi:hypothetical protein